MGITDWATILDVAIAVVALFSLMLVAWAVCWLRRL
jgi:hypothetical protein